MLIYRVEHVQSREGPYGADGLGYVCCDPWQHPAPYQDGIRFTSEHFFGFASQQQMLTWFGASNLKKFERYGYRVYKYRVPPCLVLVGGKQVAFKRKWWMVRQRAEVTLPSVCLFILLSSFKLERSYEWTNSQSWYGLKEVRALPS